MDMGVRQETACEGICPWQRGVPHIREAWELIAMSLVAHEQKNKPTLYELDMSRFEFALKAYLIPRCEWREAWGLARYLTHGLNDATVEAD